MTEASHTATEQSLNALIAELDALAEAGNGWNPDKYPKLADEQERQFRSLLCANWDRIRAALLGPLPSAVSEMATHTDHPSRHWDRTCPACVGESVIARHSMNADRREWHSVGEWLYPGDEIVVRSTNAAQQADPDAAGKAWLAPHIHALTNSLPSAEVCIDAEQPRQLLKAILDRYDLLQSTSPTAWVWRLENEIRAIRAYFEAEPKTSAPSATLRTTQADIAVSFNDWWDQEVESGLMLSSPRLKETAWRAWQRAAHLHAPR